MALFGFSSIHTDQVFLSQLYPSRAPTSLCNYVNMNLPILCSWWSAYWFAGPLCQSLHLAKHIDNQICIFRDKKKVETNINQFCNKSIFFFAKNHYVWIFLLPFTIGASLCDPNRFIHDCIRYQLQLAHRGLCLIPKCTHNYSDAGVYVW